MSNSNLHTCSCFAPAGSKAALGWQRAGACAECEREKSVRQFAESVGEPPSSQNQQGPANWLTARPNPFEEPPRSEPPTFYYKLEYESGPTSTNTGSRPSAPTRHAYVGNGEVPCFECHKPLGDEVHAAPAPIREGLCEDCGNEYPTPWFVSNDIWNQVVELSADPKNFLCMHCFVKRADKVIRCTGWEIVPENRPSAPEPSGVPRTEHELGFTLPKVIARAKCPKVESSPVDLQQEARKWREAHAAEFWKMSDNGMEFDLDAMLAAFAAHLRGK